MKKKVRGIILTSILGNRVIMGITKTR
jgi:hypothetical protein